MNARNPMVIHYVFDMDRATQFYTDVFDTKALFQSPGWTTIDFGAIELALHITTKTQGEDSPIPHAGLNVQVDDIEAMQGRVEGLGGAMTELREPDGFVPVRVAMFRDPDGNGFELRQEP